MTMIFIYQFKNILDKIYGIYTQTVDMQLYYTEFWDRISDKNKIKKQFEKINNEWLEKFILRK